MKKTGFLLIAVAFILLLAGCSEVDYDKANERTAAKADYAMNISTIVTMEDGENVRQSAINQTVKVNNKGKKNMCYSVETAATATNVNENKVSNEANSYVFYNDSYYYTYPGVRYRSPVDYDMALSNIENLSNVISFPKEAMTEVVWERAGEESVATFKIGYEDTSAFVKSLLDSSAAAFENVTFSPEEAGAACSIKKGEVAARELYIRYVSSTGESITVEIYVTYEAAEKLEAPDESKYVNIAG